MSRLALYQKYRSQTFDEMVGQEYVVRSIKNAVKTNKVGHAYLFCGPRGTGKTSMARLLARAVNCEHPENAPCGECENCKLAIEGTHPDIIEINAANETHVEDIRDLIDRARLAPMVGKHKIYIVDEVHQLSTSAASALLKTLEEPPEHVIFILATTDPQKLIKTIISRCQRFDFSRVDETLIQNHLLNIAKQEGFGLEPSAAMKIAELADGGMRDSLSILEQASAYACGDITEDTINSIFGLASTSEKMNFLNAIFDRNLEQILIKTEEGVSHGVDLRRLTADLMETLKDGIVYRYTKNPKLLKTLSEENAKQIAERKSADELLEMVKILMNTLERYKNAQSVSTVFEIACMEMMYKKETVIPVIKQTTVQEKPVNKMDAVLIKPMPSVKPIEPTPQILAVNTEKVKEMPDEDIETAAPVEPLTVMDVVSLLVQCNKAEKAADEEKYSKINSGVVMNRFVANIRQAELKASGKDCILLTTNSQASANYINETEFNKSLYEYLKMNGIDKVPFAVTVSVYDEAVKEFIKRMKEKNLPEAKQVQRYVKEIVEEIKEDPETLLKDFFGSENVEVIS